jgi:threonine dehydrogenase-like Zn-dependent dehydrogenase
VRLAELPDPELPTPRWVRVRPRLSGICGSDLATIGCMGSPYFSPFVSTPFVFGHELVGEIVETGAAVPPQWKTGMRVVIEPALGCEVREIEPWCGPCSEGRYAHCENIVRGCIQPGIQTGFCASTGGGWSRGTLVAHHSQLHAVPASVSDDEAVLAEPLACSVHAALQVPPGKGSSLLVIGCGSIGLLTIHAYRKLGGQGRLLAAARYPHQASMAKHLGADETFIGKDSQSLYRWLLDRTDGTATGRVFQPELGKPVLLGGADVVLDCVGSSQSIDDALRLTRPGGSVVLIGMPGIARGVDWTSAWYKALQIQGAYAYGWEDLPGRGRIKTMQLAIELLEKNPGFLKPLTGGHYPLENYRAALEQAFHAGRSECFKTVFQIHT